MKKVVFTILLGFSFLVLLNLHAADKSEKSTSASSSDKISENWTPLQLGFWPGTPKSVVYSRVYGIKIGFPISSGKGIVNGLEASLFASLTREVEGVQGAFVSVNETGAGIQGAIVNVTKDYQGCQFGIVNLAKKGSKKFSFVGCQFGLINHGYRNDGMQFGLLNFNEKGKIPFMPIFNFNFPDDVE